MAFIGNFLYMNALDLLLKRRSHSRLQAPAPTNDELQNIMDAALRAPDHAGLAPWRFIVCTDNGLERLGHIFQQAAIKSDMSQSDIDRASQLPLRAPMVVVAITKYIQHPKVPCVEQIASTACAVHAMQMAAVAQSYSGVWRTGSYAQNEFVKEEFGLVEDDEIVGFLYLGTPEVDLPEKPKKNSLEYFEFWR